MPRSRRRRASSASIWWPTAPTNPTAPRSARRASCTCRPWTYICKGHQLADVSCHHRHDGCGVRGDRPLMLRRLHQDQPARFAFTPANLEWAKGQISQIPRGPSGQRHHSAAVARAGTGGLADPPGDRACRRHAGHGLYPRAGSGDVLLHVPACNRSGRSRISRSAAPRPA